MQALTPDQIENIVDWLTMWDYVKFSPIPIRFRHEFSPSATKPPIGAVPEYLWKEQRRDELIAAINSYNTAKLAPPGEWYEELKSLI